MLCLNLSACPASHRLCVARSVPAARTSLSTHPPGRSGSTPQAAAPPLPSPPLPPLSQLLTALSHPNPRVASPGNLPTQSAPQSCCPFPGVSAPPPYSPSHPFPWQPERNLPYLQVRRSGLPTSHLPQLSWPKGMATVFCSLRGPLLSPHILSCLYALYLLFPLPRILFSATISLTNCYLSWAQLTPSRNLPSSWPPCPRCPEAMYASVKALSTALKIFNCLTSFPSSAALA